MASPRFTKDQKVQGAKVCWEKLWPLFFGILKVQSLWIFCQKGKPSTLRYATETLRKLKAKI